MPNTKPVTALRNYSEVLSEVTEGSPILLTEEGHDGYIIMNAREYREWAWSKLMYELEKGERSGREKGWYTHEEVMEHFRERAEAAREKAESANEE